MPELSSNIGLKKPLGNEFHTRAANNENIEIIDKKFGTGTGEGHSHNGTAGQGQKISYTDLIDKPTSFTPVAHKTTHASNGSDPITPADIGAIPNSNNSVTDSLIGSRTADQTQVPSTSTGTITQLFSWIANRIKAITGKNNWFDAPDTTLANASNHINATTAAHGGIVASSDVVTTPTANKILKLDANGKLPTSITGDAGTVGGYNPGNATGQIPVSNGTKNVNCNVDMLEGYHAGNASGQIPVSNGTMCVNLNTEKLGGHTWSEIYTAINAGNIPIIYNLNIVANNATTYAVNDLWTIGFPCNSLRIQFDLYEYQSYIAYARITKNGVAVGTERIKSGSSPQTFVEDIANWSVGDVVGIQLKTSNAAGSARATKIKVCVDKAPGLYDILSW